MATPDRDRPKPPVLKLSAYKKRKAEEEATFGARRLEAESLTDDGNARKFIEQNRGRLIYCPGVGWFRWSRQHHKDAAKDRRLWKEITTQQVEKDVKRTLRALLQEAVDMEDRDDQARALKWAIRCRSQNAVTNCRKMAESGDPHMSDLTVSINELDSNPDIINTASGIVDLQTGELRPHDFGEMCTHIAGASYRPDADQKRWLKFLERVIPDEKQREHLKLCLGASITGHHTRNVYFLYGPDGENGKTQLIEAISDTLGTYASSSMEGTFVNANATQAGYDLARMRGARFLTFSEMREDKGLAISRIKRLTGGEPVDARNPYGRPFSYKPAFDIWLATNDRPLVPGGDIAFWKRVVVWPFDVVIPKSEQVPDYGALLAREHGSAVLAWLVEGAVSWYAMKRRIPRPPDAMTQVVEEWKLRDDIVGRWIEERVETVVGRRTKGSDLYKDFMLWCELNGEKKRVEGYTTVRFSDELRRHHGFVHSKTKLDGVSTYDNVLRKPLMLSTQQV